jgi:excisionase family DNA binding protein
MHYDGDVIERLDRIECLLAEVIAKRPDRQNPFKPSLALQARVLLKVSEAAQQLGVLNSYLYQMIATGGFPSVKIRRAVRIPSEDMMNWIRKFGTNVRD